MFRQHRHVRMMVPSPTVRLPHGFSSLSRVFSSLAPSLASGSSSSSNTEGSFLSSIASAVAAAAMALTLTSNSTTETCGIVGVIGADGGPDAKDFLIEGLTILQNRGYDSAGMVTQSNTNLNQSPLQVSKFASVEGTADSIHLLRKSMNEHVGNAIGIAHTRWATHGGKSDANSHPHCDQFGHVAVVHNGTITNYNELKRELKAEGVSEFKSETDTEVIAALIGLFVEQGASVLVATQLALKRLEGTWGLCVVARDEPGKIIVARNGSPLVIGYGSDDTMYIASETTAFNRHTKRFISLQDGELAVVTPGMAELNPESLGNSGPESDSGNSLQRFPTSRLATAPDVNIRLSPDPYPHWTIREISEQPQAVAAALGYGGRVSETQVYLGGLEAEKDRMLSIQHLLIAACGTSLNASKYGAKLMRSLGAFDSVMTEDAAEVTVETLPKAGAGAGGLLVVSQSGETKDVHRVLRLAESGDNNSNHDRLPRFSVVNAVGSLIARSTKCGVYLNAGRENAVASTKAFVTQVTVMGLIAGWFAQNRQLDSENNSNNPHVQKTNAPATELIQAMHRLPITMGMALRTRNQCKEVAESLKDAEHLFVLGKGYGEPIAYEGALKIKEITYVHAEGYSGGALKHGPFALIENKTGKFGQTPIILIVLDDEHGTHMKTAAEEVRARGAQTIVITDCPSMCEDIADVIIPIPNNGPLTALLAVIPLQIIAYELALKRGINPDVPRNLAKAVTVD